MVGNGTFRRLKRMGTGLCLSGGPGRRISRSSRPADAPAGAGFRGAHPEGPRRRPPSVRPCPGDRVLPRWQLGLLLAGVLFIGFPDGAEIVNLAAAVLMTAAMLPCGVRLLRSGTDAYRFTGPARRS